MNNFLTDAQRLSLRSQHRSEKNGRVRDRIKAVLLRDKGWSLRQISEALLLDEDTVGKHVQEFLEESKLSNASGGSTGKLSEEQRIDLTNHLEEKTYLTVKEICSYVFKTYGIIYTIQGMTSWLKNNGFSYKKPKPTPAKADLEKQALFIAFYEMLLNSIGNNEIVLFMDAVHPTMATKISYGWIRTGKDKLIPTTGSKTRLNIIGTLNLEEMKLDSKEYKTIDSISVVDYFKFLKRKYRERSKIHIILDRGPANFCKNTRKEAERLGIELHYLPPYSPNLNPIERVWKVMNEHVRNNRFFESHQEFTSSIRQFFSKTWDQIAISLVDRINDNFQKILKPSFSF